eukprot:TRINITY_DN6554_c0_g2_i1.p1 TRINITY_DN6554_c0_g2~~TRINITY_DN6554_c0_g2_i1.p1  ORF type:complete len:154 (+),score=22.59 TRINITY_DN6554_c0_g2_i1:134-595(+)
MPQKYAQREHDYATSGGASVLRPLSFAVVPDSKFACVVYDYVHQVDVTESNFFLFVDSLHAAVLDLHAAGLIHNDMAMRNVLFDGRTVRLIDLELACSVHEPCLRSALPFNSSSSPKMRKQQGFASCEDDWWAVAVLAIRLVCIICQDDLCRQ